MEKVSWQKGMGSSFTITLPGFFIGSRPVMGNRCLCTSGRVVLSSGIVRTWLNFLTMDFLV